VRDSDSVVAAGKGFPVLKCPCCGENPPLKSNLGIDEELDRLSDYLTPPVEPRCSDKDCENHTIAITIGKSHYATFGTTKSGSKRYKCKAGSKTFAVGGSPLRQKQPHKNRLVFSLLMNKMPLKRICVAAGIQMPGVYGKIDFLRNQSLAFVSHRERKLLEGITIRRL